MKYLLKFACTLSLIVILSSCEDFADIEQPGRLGSEAAFQSTEDLVLGNLGVYDEFDYTPMIQFNAIFTDQISIGFDNGGQGLAGDYAFVLNSDSEAPEFIWLNQYAALNAANRVITAAEGITPEEGEEAAYNNAVGTALAMRAWAHFELLTYFSPDLTDDSAPGVIILDFVPETDQQLARNSTGEVFDAIIADINQAEGLIAVQSDPTFISQDFVRALKARLFAYRGDYASARPFAEQLLNSYPLATRSQYRNIFSDAGNAEVIFKLERTINDNYDGQGSTGDAEAGGWAGANFAFVNASVDGSPYFEMSNGLFQKLSPEDVRYDVLLHPSSDLAGGDLNSNILAIGKYTGSEGQPLMNDLKVFRSSEMLFILAEAAAANNNLAEAASLLDRLQDARFGSDQPAPSFASQQEAFAAILEARRVELAYEGFRWVDIKRLGQRAGLQGIFRDPTDCNVPGSACDLPLPDLRVQALPIPLEELDANGTIQQTPGY